MVILQLLSSDADLVHGLQMLINVCVCILPEELLKYPTAQKRLHMHITKVFPPPLAHVACTVSAANPRGMVMKSK